MPTMWPTELPAPGTLPELRTRRVERVASDGVGTSTAITVVHQAPRGGDHPPTPFAICLVELDEQVRAMGRCAPTLTVGDRVRAGFTREVPYFETVDRQESDSFSDS
jgi:uncharacterized OB-fold protein